MLYIWSDRSIATPSRFGWKSWNLIFASRFSSFKLKPGKARAEKTSTIDETTLFQPTQASSALSRKFKRIIFENEWPFLLGSNSLALTPNSKAHSAVKKYLHNFSPAHPTHVWQVDKIKFKFSLRKDFFGECDIPSLGQWYFKLFFMPPRCSFGSTESFVEVAKLDIISCGGVWWPEKILTFPHFSLFPSYTYTWDEKASEIVQLDEEYSLMMRNLSKMLIEIFTLLLTNSFHFCFHSA